MIEEPGQTAHFFFEACLRELLAQWRESRPRPVQVPHRETGAMGKRVWRGAARR